MANAINVLQMAGCQVIVDDIGFPGEPAFEDGIIAQAVSAVRSRGSIYFSAAGNAGNLTFGTSSAWEGDYAPAETTGPLVGMGTAHDWDPGAGTSSLNTLTADPQFGIGLQWADPQGVPVPTSSTGTWSACAAKTATLPSI